MDFSVSQPQANTLFLPRTYEYVRVYRVNGTATSSAMDIWISGGKIHNTGVATTETLYQTAGRLLDGTRKQIHVQICFILSLPCAYNHLYTQTCAQKIYKITSHPQT